jgi:GNAT superfamily N-acetyltransferase
LERVRNGLQRTWAEESTRWTFSSDRHGNPLLLFAHWPAQGDVWLFVTAALRNARSMLVIVHVQGDDAELVDMQGSEHVSRGIGTAALAFVEELLCERGVRKIHGWLSPEDIDHRTRQIHFYTKNGFKVNIEPGHVDGTIEKELVCP